MARFLHPMRTTLLAALLVIAAAGCETAARSDAAFDQGASRAPTVRTLHALAGVLAAKGQDAEAQLVLMRLIETNPTFLPAYSDLAELHLRHERLPEARAALMAGLEISPQDSALTNNLGMWHLLQRDYAAAASQFEKAASNSPHNRRYRANQALALGLHGEHERSAEIYRAILPSREAQHNLAIIAQARQQMGQEFIHARERASNGTAEY